VKRNAGIVTAAVLGAALVSGCRSTAATEERRTIRYLSWTTAGSFSNDLIARLGAALPDARVETEHTSGSLVVVSSVNEGKGDFGFSTADIAYTAYRRGIDQAQYPHTNLRAIAVRWVNSIYAIVPSTSDVRTIADLRGKRVGVSVQGSGYELLTRLILETYGLSYADMQARFVEADRLTDALRNRELDAIMLSATPLSDLSKVRDAGFRVVPLDRDAVKRLQSQYPFVKTVTLDRDGLGPRDSMTVGVDSVLVCRADLDEPAAYQLTKVLYQILSDLARSEPAIDPGNASATPIPLHPGAARFYREQEVLNES
jgi:TRAP transporter TAXI family solute receptor